MHKTNLYFAIFLILAGLFGFLARFAEVGDFQFTALIPAGFGLILLFLSPGMKKENPYVSHMVVLVTAIVGVLMIFMLIRAWMNQQGFDRRIIIFAVILIGSVIAMARYIRYFIRRRKSGE